MPFNFPDFEPSDAGFRNLEAASNLFDRIQRRSILEEENKRAAAKHELDVVTSSIQQENQLLTIEMNKRVLAEQEQAAPLRLKKLQSEARVADHLRALEDRWNTDGRDLMRSGVAQVMGITDVAARLRATSDLVSGLVEFQDVAGEEIAFVTGKLDVFNTQMAARQAVLRQEEDMAGVAVVGDALLQQSSGQPVDFETVKQHPAVVAARRHPESKTAAALEKLASAAATQRNQKESRELQRERFTITQGKKKAMSPTLMQSAEKVLAARMNVDSVAEEFAKAAQDTAGTGPVAGFLRDLTKRITGDINAATLNASITAALPNVARGVFNEVGVLTDQDIEHYKGLFATIRDPEEMGTVLIKMLQDKVQKAIDLKFEVYGSSYDVSFMEPYISEDLRRKRSGVAGGEMANPDLVTVTDP